MPNITINQQNLEVPAGTTLLEAARRTGCEIPTMCAGKGLPHFTSCMICMVEDLRTGALLPACSTPVMEGMRIVTESPSVLNSRRAALALLLGDHLGDCEGPCRRACPAGMDIPAMLRHIAAGEMDEARRVVLRDIALPAVLGRICPAPCEKACRRGQHDAPVAICRLKRFTGDFNLRHDLHPAPDTTAAGGRVAVVGAGPAGLAAAHALRRAGQTVTLFDRQPVAGGNLRHPELAGILPPQVLGAEINLILRQGIELRLGAEIGATIDPARLREQFDLIILATGAEEAAAMARRWGLQSEGEGIKVEKHTGRTSDDRVFACGNVVRRGRLAVHALAQGRNAALAADQVLRHQPVHGRPRGYDHRIPGRSEPEELRQWLRDADPSDRVEPAGKPVDDYNDDEARREAARCLHCDCRARDACKLRRYAEIYGASQQAWRPGRRRHYHPARYGRIIYDPGKCIACGLCIRVMEKARAPWGLSFIGRGLDVRVGTPFNASLEKIPAPVVAAALDVCPTGALTDTGRQGHQEIMP